MSKKIKNTVVLTADDVAVEALKAVVAVQTPVVADQPKEPVSAQEFENLNKILSLSDGWLDQAMTFEAQAEQELATAEEMATNFAAAFVLPLERIEADMMDKLGKMSEANTRLLALNTKLKALGMPTQNDLGQAIIAMDQDLKRVRERLMSLKTCKEWKNYQVFHNVQTVAAPSKPVAIASTTMSSITDAELAAYRAIREGSIVVETSKGLANFFVNLSWALAVEHDVTKKEVVLNKSLAKVGLSTSPAALGLAKSYVGEVRRAKVMAGDDAGSEAAGFKVNANAQHVTLRAGELR